MIDIKTAITDNCKPDTARAIIRGIIAAVAADIEARAKSVKNAETAAVLGAISCRLDGIAFEEG